MEEIARQKLIELFHAHGPTVIEDHRRCEGLLRDYLGAQSRELNLFIMVLREGIAENLLAEVTHQQGKNGTQQLFRNVLPTALVISVCVQRCVENLSITPEASRWAVESWAMALNYLSPDHSSVKLTPGVANLFDIQPDEPLIPPTILTVAQQGQGDFGTIGKAIKAAPPGARIIIKPGHYQEMLVLNKDVEIIGDGRLEEIVIENKTCVENTCDVVKIQNITLSGSLILEKGELILSGCDIGEVLAVTGESAQLTVHNSKLNILDAARGRLSLEECVIRAVNFSDHFGLHPSQGTLISFPQYMSLQPVSSLHGEATNLVFQAEKCMVGSVSIAKGNPYFSNCAFLAASASMYSQPHYYPLVKITNGGAGVFENCDLLGHEQGSTIAILGEGNPVFRHCAVHHSSGIGAIGMFFGEDTEGLVEECEISNCGYGIEIAHGSSPTIRASKITHNSEYGILIHDHGSGLIEDCDLSNNKLGATKIEPHSFAEKSHNKE